MSDQEASERQPARISVSWWEGVVLLLEPAVQRGRTVELFRGHLMEAVHTALERPFEEQRRLVIVTEASRKLQRWDDIAALAARPDFPALI